MKGATAKAFFCAALGNIIWGFSFLFTRVCLDAAANPTVLQGKYVLSLLSLSLLCSIVANLLVNYAAGILSVFQLSSFGALSTLCSMLAGVVFLKEPVSVALLLGTTLILVGVREVTKPK